MPNYRPHYKGADDPLPPTTPPDDPNYEQSIVIMPNPPAGPGWRIVWDKSPGGDHEEHIAATRDEAIAWSKERCEYIQAWNDDKQDLEAIG